MTPDDDLNSHHVHIRTDALLCLCLVLVHEPIILL